MASADEYAAWIVKNADKKGTPDFDVVAKAYQDANNQPTTTAAPQTELTGAPKIIHDVSNLVPGAIRGAGSIGATIIRALPNAIGGDTAEESAQRRSSIDAGLQQLGADPNSIGYKGGKILGEVAGTAGTGGILANGLRAVAPSAVGLTNALATSGMQAGTTPGTLNILTRIAGGAGAGAASAGLVDPTDVDRGGVIGAALPTASVVLNKTGNALSGVRESIATKLMNSALKPTLAQKQSGDAAIAVQTLLDNGINPTSGGVNKLRGMIGDLNDQIANKIGNSTATINKQDVINSLSAVKNKFTNQVDPLPDLNTIQNVADRFNVHPALSGNDIPVQTAQDLKQGTYKVLASKYGQIGTADTEAQKGLARGLKEGIANAVPDVANLNAQESKLITTLGVTERRALMDLNKNPMGLSLLAHNPISWAAFMADKSALFKSLAARMINPSESSSVTSNITNALSPAAYKTAPVLANSIQK